MHRLSGSLLLRSIFPWLAPLMSLSASAIADTHLFASPGHSTSFFVFPAMPKAPNFCLEGQHHHAGVWLLCISKGGPGSTHSPSGWSRWPGKGWWWAFWVYLSVSLPTGGLGAPFWPPLPSVCGTVLLPVLPLLAASSTSELATTITASQVTLSHTSPAPEHCSRSDQTGPDQRLGHHQLQGWTWNFYRWSWRVRILLSQFLSCLIFTLLTLSPHPTGGEWASSCVRSCHPPCWMDSLSQSATLSVCCGEKMI